MFDLAQLGDGAAAVVVTREDCIPPDVSAPPIRILASANATAQLSIHDRPQLLTYTAAAQSAERALNQANIRLKKIDAFELDDKTAIDLILSLEAIGLSHPGNIIKAVGDACEVISEKISISKEIKAISLECGLQAGRG